MNSSQNPSALRSKKIITETLLRLMEQYPYAEITVKHILLESTVSRKTFYRNFSSKDDVLNSYIDAILLSYLDTLKENEQYSFLRILDVIFYFCQENKKTLLLFRDNELLYLLLMKLNKLIPFEHEKISRYDSELLSEYIVSFNIGGIWNTLVKWIENDMRDSADDIMKTIVYYLSHIKNIDMRDV